MRRQVMNKSKSNELLSCPFCGASAEFEYIDNGYGTGYVQCTECGVSIFGGRDSAIEMWNRRSI